jgi:hypothetical protein
MQILASILISAVMVVGSLFYQKETAPPALGASQTISSLTAGTSLDDADVLPYTDTASLTTKKITWGNATSTLKTFYDTIYSPIFSTSATLAGLLSDEQGSGGGFVRATSPTITTPVLTSPTINTSFLGNAVLSIAQGGTGSTTKNDALNALLPTQTGNSGKFLQTNATDASWSSLTFPTNNGVASSTVLMNDASGNLSWGFPFYALASSTDKIASSTSNGIFGTASTVIVKTATFRLFGGNGYCTYYLEEINPGGTMSGKLYVNGTQYGPSHVPPASKTTYHDEFYAPATSTPFTVSLAVTTDGGHNIGYGMFACFGKPTATSSVQITLE